MIHVLDFNSTILDVHGFMTPEEVDAFPIPEGFDRLIVREPTELAALDNPTLLRLYNAGEGPQIKKLKDRDDAFNAIWARWENQPAPEKDLNLVRDEPKSPKVKTGVSAPKKSKAKGNTALAATEEAPKAPVKKEANVAKAKTASKKKAAAPKKAAAKKNGTKKSTGPRGEKTLEVRRLLLRKSGVTRAEILAATGWPSVSVQAMAKNCGLKLTKTKEKGSVTSYFGKE